MRLYLISIFFILKVTLPAGAQETDTQQEKVELDSVPMIADPHYREDQFYASFTYNLMMGKPKGYKQYSFSTGITTGFLRDIPINKARNRAIAIGVGYSYNNIKHNLEVQQGVTPKAPNSYTVADNFNKNKLVLHYLEFPLELRWRTSDSISHKFWRIYAGFKASYLFADKAQYSLTTGGDFKVCNDVNMNKWIYGAYISAGWNTWNFYGYYGFTPVYKSAYTDAGEKVNLHTAQVGLMFYIL